MPLTRLSRARRLRFAFPGSSCEKSAIKKKHIAIVSHADDLHALAVQDAFDRYGDVVCSVIESNCIANSGKLHWSVTSDAKCSSVISAVGGRVINPAHLDVVWWRRANYPQRLPTDITNPAHLDLINNDAKTSLLGVLCTDFHGRWISEPACTERADNKLVQLQAAQEVGLAIPLTIVSQDYSAVRQFCIALDHQVIVKAVRGTRLRGTLTRKLPDGEALPEDLVQLCPTIYQQYIPGTEHVRVHCFGDKVYSVMIRSNEVDWRRNLNVPMASFTLPSETSERILRVLKLMGLRMGIIDLKLMPSGEPVWLEVNPQGQFLFIQALSGVDLITPFVEFLYEEARGECWSSEAYAPVKEANL